jgi:hypothetical protein
MPVSAVPPDKKSLTATGNNGKKVVVVAVLIEH